MKKTSLIPMLLTALIAAAAGVGIGLWYAQPSSPTSNNTAQSADSNAGNAQETRKALYWYDPMVPQHRFDKPGKSPFMDMDLVPKYADDGDDAATVRIDPAIQSNLGVRTTQVRSISPERSLDAIGTLAFNTRDVAIVQVRAEGFVERAYPYAVGDVIQKGAPLLEVMVPSWVAAQQEFLALQTADEASLIQASRQRLRLLGMPESVIDTVARTGKPQTTTRLSAPIGGMIQTLDARTGMTLNAGQTVAQIVGLDPVWLDIAVPESNSQWLARGDRADITFAAWPGERFSGKVLDILPETQKETRTLTVRLALPNPQQRLKPGMFARVHLVSAHASSTAQLVVPSEAVIRTGQRTLVMLAEEGGRFRPAEIDIGEDIGHDTVILKGLKEGERVVTSGQFLIDSEANMKGVMARTSGESAAATATTPPLHEADGTIVEIDGKEILLQHGPFPTLHMGAMTMLFPVARPELLEGLQPGDAVRVGVRADDQGMTIERIDKRTATATPATTSKPPVPQDHSKAHQKAQP